MAYSGRIQPPFGLFIDMSAGNHTFIDRTRQFTGQYSKIAEVPGGGRQRTENHRVIAPDNRPRPELPRKALYLRDGAVGTRCMGIQGARIAGHGELDDEWQLQLRHVVQCCRKGGGVPGPEHVSVDSIPAQRHSIRLAAIGVGDLAKTRIQAGPEPVGMKRRNIAAITGGNNHGPDIPLCSPLCSLPRSETVGD